MSSLLNVNARTAFVRAALAIVLVTGIMLAMGVARAGATISVTWSSISYPAGLPDNDCGNEFAVDAAGNVYTLNADGSFNVYTPSTNTTVTLDSSHDFYNICGAFEDDGAFFTVDSSGNIYVSGDLGYIWKISPAGTESVVTTGLEIPGPLATDQSGNLFAYDFATESVYEIVGSTPVLVHSIGSDEVNSIAVGPDESVYASDYEGGHVWRVTSSGAAAFGSGWCNPESVAVDSAGNVFVADECNDSVTEVPVGGVQDLLTVPPGIDDPQPDEVFTVGSSLYYYDEDVTTTIYSLGSLSHPPMLGATSADQTVDGVLGQTITATWSGVPGAISYTCTLMYGFGAPSSFTVTTPGHTCSFGSLSPNSEFGIEVVANSGSSSSAPSVAFAAPPPLPSNPPPAKHTIVCKKNHKTAIRTVTGLHPTCPAGWHRVA